MSRCNVDANIPCRSKEEREAWEKMDPEEREKEYLPQKYNALRKVPAWTELTKERFERCMVCGPNLFVRFALTPNRLGPVSRTSCAEEQTQHRSKLTPS